MIGLSLLLSVSKHNMWSHYDWVFVVGLLTDDNDNPIIIRPHIVFTDGRQQSLLLSVSKRNMWSCYDWVVVVVVCQ
jgi:hypothetical protein